jgi:alpha-1,6-mannosyltransferase
MKNKAILAVSIILYVSIAYFIERENTEFLLLVWAGLFAAYFYWLKFPPKNGVRWGIFFRILFLVAIPTLSDDVFRFIWDGNLLVNNINPYEFTPKEVLDNQGFTAIFKQKNELFFQLNSPNYYSVYPPLNQFFFAAAAFLSQQNTWVSTVILRCFILLAEIGTLYFLPVESHEKKNIYALNPLIIIELTGNLHFEALVIFFLVVMYRLLLSTQRKIVWAAIFYSFSVLTKLLPLIFLPLILRKLHGKERIYFLFVTSFLVIGFFSIFLNYQIVQNILKSLNLYFQTFEFNASLFYIVRQIGFWAVGYNLIFWAGKLLAFCSFLLILWVSWGKNPFTTLQKSSLILFIYLVFSTTVHPWYVAPLVALGSFRFPLVWTAVLPLTYVSYSTNPYKENLYLVAIEYIVLLFFFIVEIKKGDFFKKNAVTFVHKSV